MRIPLHKIYRAFPEFDRFSDERCEAYMRYVRTRYAARLWSTSIGLWIGAPLVGLFALWPVLVGANIVAQWATGSPFPPNTPFFLAMACGIAVTLSVVALAALVVRDTHLRRVMRLQLNGVTCGKCSYNLLGAVVRDGAVRCPECGEAFFIADRGLCELDFMVDRDNLPGIDNAQQEPQPLELDPAEKSQLLSRVRSRRDLDVQARISATTMPRTPPASCRGCGFSLSGLQAVDTTLRCPECGALHTIINLEQKNRLIHTVARTRDQLDDNSATP